MKLYSVSSPITSDCRADFSNPRHARNYASKLAVLYSEDIPAGFMVKIKVEETDYDTNTITLFAYAEARGAYKCACVKERIKRFSCQEVP